MPTKKKPAKPAPVVPPEQFRKEAAVLLLQAYELAWAIQQGRIQSADLSYKQSRRDVTAPNLVQGTMSLKITYAAVEGSHEVPPARMVCPEWITELVRVAKRDLDAQHGTSFSTKAEKP